MNMNTVPEITQEHMLEAFGDTKPTWGQWSYAITDFCNKAIEIALAEQSAQQEQYITAAQARELGAGNAVYTIEDSGVWHICFADCDYLDKTGITGRVIKYRAITQAEPEPADPHAALRDGYTHRHGAQSGGITGIAKGYVLEGAV
jgi:hypothetical protein